MHELAPGHGHDADPANSSVTMMFRGRAYARG
jgi:hypothetical protein